jgi:hypothetical protein
MAAKPSAAFLRGHGRSVRGRRLLAGLALAAALSVSAAQAAERPAAALLLDRMCGDSLRANEEDRLYGMISLTVRTTIKDQGGVFSPDLIDDAVQDGLDAMIAACPQIAATADDERLGMVVGLIRDAAVKRLLDKTAGYSARQTEKATAADLSEELSAEEIDAWLAALPARQRALALFLYAEQPTAKQIADAVGLPAAGLPAAFHDVKGDLLRFFTANWNAPVPPPVPAAPAIEYREAPAELPALIAPAPEQPATVRISGISTEIYAGWSLLLSLTGLPAERSLELDKPIIFEPDAAGQRRMLAVALDEIGDPHDATRRFLVKAYAIDGDKEGAGLRDTFHVGAPLANPAAEQTLGNRRLAAIETARCLWHDFATAPDPGLCR